jgi:hypothetical protein
MENKIEIQLLCFNNIRWGFSSMNYAKIAKYSGNRRDYFSLLSSSKTVYNFCDGCDKKTLDKYNPPLLRLISKFPDKDWSWFMLSEHPNIT